MNNLLQKLMLGGSTAALVAAMPIAARAQGDADIEQVVVSASRITIAGYTQPTPVTVVGAAQLEKDAFANIQDAIRQLPQVSSPPSSFSATPAPARGGTAGENLLNLRNLGNTQNPGPVRRPARGGFQHQRRRGHQHPADRPDPARGHRDRRRLGRLGFGRRGRRGQLRPQQEFHRLQGQRSGRRHLRRSQPQLSTADGSGAAIYLAAAVI